MDSRIQYALQLRAQPSRRQGPYGGFPGTLGDSEEALIQSCENFVIEAEVVCVSWLLLLGYAIHILRLGD